MTGVAISTKQLAQNVSEMLQLHVFSVVNFPPYFYLPPGGSPEREIMKCSLCVHGCVRACVRVWVRACMRPLVCHADCSKTIAGTNFLSKKSPNEFSCPRIFTWFYSFWAKIEWVIAIFATLNKCFITSKLLHLEMWFQHIFLVLYSWLQDGKYYEALLHCISE